MLRTCSASRAHIVHPSSPQHGFPAMLSAIKTHTAVHSLVLPVHTSTVETSLCTAAVCCTQSCQYRGCHTQKLAGVLHAMHAALLLTYMYTPAPRHHHRHITLVTAAGVRPARPDTPKASLQTTVCQHAAHDSTTFTQGDSTKATRQ
jgi:hypothetical protein